MKTLTDNDKINRLLLFTLIPPFIQCALGFVHPFLGFMVGLVATTLLVTQTLIYFK